MEQLLEDGINALHLGPQGMGGDKSVMGVNIEHGSRHPSVISVCKRWLLEPSSRSCGI